MSQHRALQLVSVTVLCLLYAAGDGHRRAIFPPLAEADPPEAGPLVADSPGAQCRRRIVESSVQREDEEGRVCRGRAAIAICAGRCESQEVGEWKFPWKKWRHPVCGFSGRALSMALLEDCEAGAGWRARVLPLTRPAACVCRPCLAAHTSCLPWTTPPQLQHDDIPLPDLDSL